MTQEWANDPTTAEGAPTFALCELARRGRLAPTDTGVGGLTVGSRTRVHMPRSRR